MQLIPAVYVILHDRRYTKQTDYELEFCNAMWYLIEKLLPTLKPVDEIEALASESYPSASWIIPMITGLKMIWQQNLMMLKLLKDSG